MKNPSAMTLAELRRYVKYQNKMIHSLQVQLRKALAAHPGHQVPREGTTIPDAHLQMEELLRLRNELDGVAVAPARGV